ncbi:hypothetical protein TREES_T100001563 [Tupaia chinensis]|uniref:Uncharacterized protein n=1 Tax=Tupaia chinensis TaxID=246437 RepID=L9KPE3_TUPCH|nr:hypothetical protein TREES_T100001563 [Tupaia chinensis]
MNEVLSVPTKDDRPRFCDCSLPDCSLPMCGTHRLFPSSGTPQQAEKGIFVYAECKIADPSGPLRDTLPTSEVAAGYQPLHIIATPFLMPLTPEAGPQCPAEEDPATTEAVFLDFTTIRSFKGSYGNCSPAAI